MAIGREINHLIGLFLLEELVNCLAVGDIDFGKAEILSVHHGCQRLQIAGIGQLVHA